MSGPVLTQAGISAFGLAMPTLSPGWTMGALPSVNDADMSLAAAAGVDWVAPAFGTLRVVVGSDLGVTLVQPSGSLATGPGMLLTLYPQVLLRLKRLYALLLEEEADARPERNRGLPFRPVPCYFLYSGSFEGSPASGHMVPGAEILSSGQMTVYDEAGMPVDPLAVASTFQAFMNQHNILQRRAPRDPFDANHQVASIAGLAGPAAVRLRLADAAGQPNDGSRLTGITAVNAANGLFTLDAASGSGSDLTGTIGKMSATAAGGTFPPALERLVKFGPATTGRLRSADLTLPALPSGVTLQRDFFSIRVTQLGSELLGTPSPGFLATAKQPPVVVRLHEPLDLLADGNDVLAAAAQALDGAEEEQLAVGQAIDGAFAVADEPGSAAHWPQFPAPGTTPEPGGPLPPGLREGFLPEAHFFDDGNPDTANADVILTLRGLPEQAAVRAYNRQFVEDAREARGPGAGGVATGGQITLRLPDPLGLRRPGLAEAAIILPSQPTLRVDVMVVKRTGEARLYGNVNTPIGPPAPAAALPPAGTNPFSSAARRGVSRAGVLGLGGAKVDTTDLLEAALALSGEGNPRDAPRLPTMARRELLVAGLPAATGGAWRAVLAGGRLTPETHSAGARQGSPGSLGGRETQVVGLSTQNGRLAYDIARMAFRRTSNIVTRLIELADNRWNEPPEPTEVQSGASATATAGTFAGAVLQSISPFCETPELATLQTQISSIPDTFDDLVDWVANNLVPAGIAFRQKIIDALNDLKDDNTLSESVRERLFNEIKREIVAAGLGRRDTQWALQGAIGRARRFIYIESPGFTKTAREYKPDPVPDYAVDLVKTLADRLEKASGLHLIVCTPKFADFAAGYEGLAAREVKHRLDTLCALPTASNPNPDESRIVAFHPIGFPGRPSRLESTVVIIDDVWAMVGSSTFRRRGLTFDGGSDVAFTDTDLVNGRSPAIAAFRRRLMAQRLGIPETDSSAALIQPEPNFVRLGDGVEAFHVVRELLTAGGLGRIERLWNGQIQGVVPTDPSGISFELASPDGLEFDLAEILALSTVASLNAF